ncbi:hypothetical protein [Flavobacterium sp.]|uniref:hypothetical protein n=1 Tax=Flavobacterium sp. TaxID=239 RepID=UPI0035B13C43
MKKKFVLIVLFVLPLVVYMFFATGVNSFIKLPVLTKTISDINQNWHTLDGKKATFNNKITIVGFPGDSLFQKRGSFFLLNQKIYNRNHEFKDFQMVFIAPDGTQKQAQEILSRLKKLIDVSGYHFVFAPKNEINVYFENLKLKGKLDQNSGTNTVYIIDKERNIRGRKGKSVQGDEEYREGYDFTSSSELHNEMTDDVKIVLAEYRLALKKNSANRKI